MAQRPSLNQDKLDALKREIHYETLVNNLPAENVVLLNWLDVLKRFTGTEGTTWEISWPGIAMRPDQGKLDANLKSDKGEMSIVVHVFNAGQREAVDYALWASTNNNASFIGYKLEKNCFSDFCLIPRIMHNVNFMKYVYGNIMIELSHFDDNEEVLSVARHLQSVMEQAVAANPEGKLPAKPKLTYQLDHTPIKVGETFTVTTPPNYPNDEWEFESLEKEISSNVEYIDESRNVFRFKALAPGPGEIKFSLMDKKTLWVFTEVFRINIEPESK